MQFTDYLLLTESALDLLLLHRLFDESGRPVESQERGVFARRLTDGVTAFATPNEPEEPFSALVRWPELCKLLGDSPLVSNDVYSRIARVVKSLKNPPIHLPRPWSEFHHKNLVTFFALPKKGNGESFRWIVDTNGQLKCARFEALTSSAQHVELSKHVPGEWPASIAEIHQFSSEIQGLKKTSSDAESLIDEVDLQVIGSGSVVRHRTFEAWLEVLSDEQKKVLNARIDRSVRIIGPAGSGKTLALCLKVVSVARHHATAAQAKKILVVAHSWAMAERIDSALQTLAGGATLSGVTVLPLLYVLEIHTSQGASQNIEVIGDDSKDGRVASIELIRDVLNEETWTVGDAVSKWFADSLSAPGDSITRTDLALNLYDEFTGVLSAEGVVVDDTDSIKKYISSAREDWMPPFSSIADRRLVIQLYRRFIAKLSDRGAITTDQFVSDAIRVLETFSWRTRRETDGYDFIFVDELQLFDSQERLALELLGRSRTGVPFVTAEDPSQGVFAPLHRRQASGGVDTSVYLNAVHRFDPAIFETIKFIYQRFPLNTIPLRIDAKRETNGGVPVTYLCDDDDAAIQKSVECVKQATAEIAGEKRLCVITLGDVDDKLFCALGRANVPLVQLRGFDDVEQLSYRKRSVVLAPWQYVGGTQFSHVLVVAAGMRRANSSFGKLRELTAIYLACSRAVERLEIVCGDIVPTVLSEAISSGLVKRDRVH